MVNSSRNALRFLQGLLVGAGKHQCIQGEKLYLRQVPLYTGRNRWLGNPTRIQGEAC